MPRSRKPTWLPRSRLASSPAPTRVPPSSSGAWAGHRLHRAGAPPARLVQLEPARWPARSDPRSGAPSGGRGRTAPAGLTPSRSSPDGQRRVLGRARDRGGRPGGGVQQRAAAAGRPRTDRPSGRAGCPPPAPGSRPAPRGAISSPVREGPLERGLRPRARLVPGRTASPAAPRAPARARAAGGIARRAPPRAVRTRPARPGDQQTRLPARLGPGPARPGGVQPGARSRAGASPAGCPSVEARRVQASPRSAVVRAGASPWKTVSPGRPQQAGPRAASSPGPLAAGRRAVGAQQPEVPRLGGRIRGASVIRAARPYRQRSKLPSPTAARFQRRELHLGPRQPGKAAWLPARASRRRSRDPPRTDPRIGRHRQVPAQPAAGPDPAEPGLRGAGARPARRPLGPLRLAGRRREPARQRQRRLQRALGPGRGQRHLRQAASGGRWPGPARRPGAAATNSGERQLPGRPPVDRIVEREAVQPQQRLRRVGAQQRPGRRRAAPGAARARHAPPARRADRRRGPSGARRPARGAGPGHASAAGPVGHAAVRAPKSAGLEPEPTAGGTSSGSDRRPGAPLAVDGEPPQAAARPPGGKTARLGR